MTRERKIAAATVGFAVLIAMYTGLRLPNRWSATLQSVSLFDGFHRRFLVGTLLRPLAYLAHDSYALYASFSFIVLATLLAIVVAYAVRTESLAVRLWCIAWFLLPTGGFLFNEVGYFEQVLYVMLFASIWLVGRGRVVAATVIMSLAPFVHEIAILTVLPVYGVVLLRAVPLRRAMILMITPIVLNVIVLVIPAASAGAVAGLEARLAQADFTFRVDAIALFQRTQEESWKLYHVHSAVVYVRPAMYVLVALFGLVWLSDRRGWGMAPLLVAASAAAIAIPSLLVYGGWDGNRWLFLVIGNFFLIVWLALRAREQPALTRESISVLVIAVLLVSHVSIWYFDRLSPRELAWRPVAKFLKGVVDGSTFELANE